MSRPLAFRCADRIIGSQHPSGECSFCAYGCMEIPLTISFDTASCRNFDTAIGAEWLCTNGLGGYASGTVAGANTRKYHGLLVAAAKPPVQRYVVLSRVEERIILPAAGAAGEGSETAVDLSTNEFG